jgi:hypothetical protein
VPVERGARFSGRSAVVVGLAGVIAGIGLFVVITLLASTGGVQVQLGDDTFEAGEIGRISQEIVDGGPILYSDVAGGSRDIYLQHLGDDPEIGWSAFAAQQPGADRECFLDWQADQAIFVDPCDLSEWLADGTGLPQYVVIVDTDLGVISVDINDINASATTTTATSTTSTTGPDPTN